MRKYQKMQAIIMCGALVASSTSVLAAKEASSEAKSESATEAVSEAVWRGQLSAYINRNRRH